ELVATLPGKDAFRLGGTAFSPDGKTLAVIESSKVLLWQIAEPDHPRLRLTIDEPSDPELVGSVAFSPDGKSLAAGKSGGAAWMYDTATGGLQQRLQGRHHYVFSLAFRPDGKLLATAGGSAVDQETGDVQLWQLPAGERGRRFSADHVVSSVAFSPDGQT